MNMLNLGKIIDPNEFQYYIDEAEKLETVVHKYGSVLAVPDYPCWMEYKNEGNILGSISFTRNTHKHPVLIEMTHKVYNILKDIFPHNRQVLLERIHFIRTIGSIVTHKDEGGRNSCINIGVKNSTGAYTKMSNDGIRSNFKNNHSTIVVLEGHA